MKAILDTLAERHQAYQEAYILAQHDPDIDLSRTDGPQYTQPPYVSLLPRHSQMHCANTLPRTPWKLTTHHTMLKPLRRLKSL